MPQPYIDITGATAYREATGDGTLNNPYVPEFTSTPAFASTSTLTAIACSTTSVTLLNANNNRRTAIIINDSTADLYIVFSTSAASTANFSGFLAGKVGNTPSFMSFDGEDYSGRVNGVWVGTVNGNARITETSQ